MKLPEKPENWRTGQTLFNFLEWLHEVKGLTNAQSGRMADPFHLADDQMKLYWKEYIELLNRPKNN